MAKSDARLQWEAEKAKYPLVPAKFFNLGLGPKLDAVDKAIRNEYKYSGGDQQKAAALTNAIRTTGTAALEVLGAYTYTLQMAYSNNPGTPMGDQAGNLCNWLMLIFVPEFRQSHPILHNLQVNLGNLQNPGAPGQFQQIGNLGH